MYPRWGLRPPRPDVSSLGAPRPQVRRILTGGSAPPGPTYPRWGLRAPRPDVSSLGAPRPQARRILAGGSAPPGPAPRGACPLEPREGLRPFEPRILGRRRLFCPLSWPYAGAGGSVLYSFAVPDSRALERGRHERERRGAHGNRRIGNTLTLIPRPPAPRTGRTTSLCSAAASNSGGLGGETPPAGVQGAAPLGGARGAAPASGPGRSARIRPGAQRPHQARRAAPASGPGRSARIRPGAQRPRAVS